MKKQELLYKKIKDIQERHDLTIAKISKETGLSKQTISHRILNIKKRGIINIAFIEKIEELTGEEILSFKFF